jgi:uncharacterized protein YndB with AHSA1/START domain/DNA-binding transcriptional ArsR family regulator
MAVDAVGTVSDPRVARLLLDPLRRRIVELAKDPAGASGIARLLGLSRQKVNYHLGQLARGGLLRRVGRVRRRGLFEQLYQASAETYVLSPGVLGALAAEAGPGGDVSSASSLMAVASQLQSELGRAQSKARRRGRRFATLGVNMELRFESVEQRRTFARELRKAVAALVGRYTAPLVNGRGRPHRLVIGAYPIPSAATSTRKPRRWGRTLESAIRTRATCRQAWEAFADTERIKDWWVDEVTGKAAVGAEMVFGWKPFAMRCPVRILASVPGQRLVLEWSDPGHPGPVVWEIDAAREDAETVVRLVASGFGEGVAGEEMYDHQKAGVDGLMLVLKHYLDNHFGKRRRVVSVARATTRPEEACRLVARDTLTRWLARDADIGEPGQRARLVLRDGRTWTGVVGRAGPGRIEISCDEVEGHVSLLCWQQSVSVTVTGWKLTRADAAQLEDHLGEALDDLIALSHDTRCSDGSKVV